MAAAQASTIAGMRTAASSRRCVAITNTVTDWAKRCGSVQGATMRRFG